jgi:hypothetical protein
LNTQVIAATQSSVLLDHFAPEDVLAANRVDWWHSAYAFEVGGVGRVAFSKAKA